MPGAVCAEAYAFRGRVEPQKMTFCGFALVFRGDVDGESGEEVLGSHMSSRW